MTLKRIVHPKMKLLSSFSQPHIVTNLANHFFFVFCRCNESQKSNIVLEPTSKNSFVFQGRMKFIEIWFHFWIHYPCSFCYPII